MQRVAVIGCSGSGKTTLANEIGRTLDLPVLHVDGVYWRKVPGVGQVESTPEEWVCAHRDLVSRDRWVIDGMKLGVLPARLEAADTVVFLDVPTRTCLWGILRRRLRYRGRLAPEVGVYDRVTTEQLRWVWSFRRVQRPRIIQLLGECSCRVVRVRSWDEARRFAASIRGTRPVATAVSD